MNPELPDVQEQLAFLAHLDQEEFQARKDLKVKLGSQVRLVLEVPLVSLKYFYLIN